MRYRSDLPERPRRMRQLPLDDRGYPVPWFVAFIDDKPDFRVIKPDGIAIAHNKQVCWLCGERRGAYLTFVVGPMCGINRVTAEPPCHTECADYAVQACPFLTRPMAVRNNRDMPEDAGVAGNMIERNPGVTLLWTTKNYKTFRPNTGVGHHANVLFRLGEPTVLRFFAKGRPATREEIEESIRTGLPFLQQEAEKDGPDSMKMLNHQHRIFNMLLAKFAPR